MFLVAVFNPVIPSSPYGFASFVILTQLFCFVPPLLIYSLVVKPKKLLRFTPISLMNAVLIVLMCLFIQPAMLVLSALSMIFFENPVTGMLSDLSATPLPVALIVLAIMPSVLEEITMRGVVQRNYESVPIGKAALVNGFLFGILHLNPQQFLYAMMLGVIFAYFMHYAESLWAPILGHFTINATQIIMATVSMRVTQSMPEQQVLLESITGDEIVGLVISLVILNVICLPAFLVLFKSFVDYNKRRRAVRDAARPVPVSIDETVAEEAPVPAPARVVDWAFIAIVLFYIGFMLLLRA